MGILKMNGIPHSDTDYSKVLARHRHFSGYYYYTARCSMGPECSRRNKNRIEGFQCTERICGAYVRCCCSLVFLQKKTNLQRVLIKVMRLKKAPCLFIVYSCLICKQKAGDDKRSRANRSTSAGYSNSFSSNTQPGQVLSSALHRVCYYEP